MYLQGILYTSIYINATLPFWLGMGLGGDVIHLRSNIFYCVYPHYSSARLSQLFMSSESKDRCPLYAGHSRIKGSSVYILFIWQKLHSRCSFGTLIYLPVSICSLWVDMLISRMAFLCFMFVRFKYFSCLNCCFNFA